MAKTVRLAENGVIEAISRAVDETALSGGRDVANGPMVCSDFYARAAATSTRSNAHMSTIIDQC
jgi:hypothetical protein